MSPLLSYLAAQARRRPVATARFVGSELWRRGRMRMNTATAEAAPDFAGHPIVERFAPLLPGAQMEPRDFRLQHPGAEARILAEADRVCCHENEIFGERASFNGRLDWHADWQAAHRWPLVPVRHIRIVNGVPGADIKRPWELARFHHALPLAQAYALTQDAKYAAAFRAQVLDWIERNPYPLGIHWAMPMEAAVRAINLAMAAAWFSGAEDLDSAFWQKLLASLYTHGRHVYAHREWNPVARGNHYLSCVAGLCCLGVLFRDSDEGRRWLAFGRRALANEMAAQVGADGVAHEGSSGYHLFVTELMLTAAIALARLDSVERGSNGASGSLHAQLTKSWGKGFAAKLEKMLEFVAAQVHGRSAAPIWGDADDGRVLPLCSCPASPAQHLLAAGRALFDRADWPASDASCCDARWRLGDSNPGSEQNYANRATANPGFPDAGFFFFSSPRIRGSVRCGPLGINGWANHAHCDQLNFEFCWEGQPVVVDPGTYLYSGDPAERNWFRSTAAHNTPEVEGTEQNRYWNDLLFRIMDDTRSRLLRWRDDESQLEFSGEHYGYQRLRQRVTVARNLRLDRRRDRLSVSDTVFGRGSAVVAWRFQFAPGLEVQQSPASKQETSAHTGTDAEQGSLAFHSAWKVGPLLLRILCSEPATLTGRLEDGWVAPRYGRRERAPALQLTGRFQLPARLHFTFAPIDEDSHT